MTGEGLFLRPLPSNDLASFDGSGRSLHDAEWCAVLRHLDQLGRDLSENEHGDPAHVGTTSDGRQAIGLYGREPVTSDPTTHEQARALRVLCVDAGVTPSAR